MKSFKAKEGFQAYPSGKFVEYHAGQTYEGPDAFVDMLVLKGHVVEIPGPSGPVEAPVAHKAGKKE